MNNSGDAAEQIVRLSLDGVEVAAKITGAAAKELAIMLIAALKKSKGNTKLKGKERLTSMLKSGKALEIISVRDRDLSKFAQGAKEYGIVYCVLRNTKNSPDGICDIMVKADDAPKISRLIERFKFATVDKAKLEGEIAAEKAAKTGDAKGAGPEAWDAADSGKLPDGLTGPADGKAAPDKPEVEKSEPRKMGSAKDGKAQADTRPLADGGPGRLDLSAPTSASRKTPEGATLSKPSVKEEMREIKAARKQKEAEAPKLGERTVPDKPKDNQTAAHKQPQRGKPAKSKGGR